MFKIYNPQTAPSSVGRVTTPAIRFAKNGVVTINKTACQQLNLSEGDCIEFGQSERHAKDWFVRKSEQGYKLRKIDTGTLVANCSAVCAALKLSLGKSVKDSISISVAPEMDKSFKGFGLLTAAVQS